MRLLFVARAYYPAVRYGGPVHSLRRMCEGLAQRGHAVRVICSDMASPGPRADRVPAGSYQINRVGVTFLRTVFRWNWEGIPVRGVSRIREAVQGADVLTITGTRHFLGALAVHASRRSGTPHVVIPEGSIPPRARSIGLKRFVDAFNTRSVMSSASVVIAKSEDERRDLCAWGLKAHNVVVLPPVVSRLEPSRHSVKQLRDKWRLPQRVPVALWIGRIHPEKGLSTLIQALSYQGLEDVHVVIAGTPEDDRYMASLSQVARRAEVIDRIQFVGWVGEREKSELYKLATVFVLCSRKENFGHAAAEAMASGMALVVTETCGIAASVREAGGLVCHYDPRDVATAIRQVVQHPEVLQEMRRVSDQVARTYSLQHAIEVLEETYRESIEMGAHRAQ